MNILKCLFIPMILIGFMSCNNGGEAFDQWIRQNQGKKFTAAHMEELVSTFGNPIDSSTGGDVEIRGFTYALFLGPAFEIEEGKLMYEQASSEWRSLFAYWEDYMNRTGEEQGLSPNFRFSDQNYNWSDYITARDAYYDKYEKIYKERSGEQTLTLGEFFAAYQKKYPELNQKQCVDSIKSFNFIGVDDFELKNLQTKKYSFLVEKSVSYKKTFGKEKEDIKDFEIDLTSELAILGDGTISDNTYASGYCITEDSRNNLKEKVVGEWVYRLNGSVVGSFKFNDDGTYSMSNQMFGGMSKKGKWKINCSGEIDATNQNVNLIISDDGISVGKTLYKKN